MEYARSENGTNGGEEDEENVREEEEGQEEEKKEKKKKESQKLDMVSSSLCLTCSINISLVGIEHGGPLGRLERS